MEIFPDTQGQLLLNFEPIRDFMVVLVAARIMKNKSKMKELEWSQDFTYYNPMGAICAMEIRVLIRSGPKPNAVNHPPQ